VVLRVGLRDSRERIDRMMLATSIRFGQSRYIDEYCGALDSRTTGHVSCAAADAETDGI
jgi:hypothetical protein